MTIGHKAGHYCHFRVLCRANGDTGSKEEETKERSPPPPPPPKKDRKRQEKKKSFGIKSFGIYWEGDDTFNLKVRRVGDRTASGKSLLQSLTVRGMMLLL